MRPSPLGFSAARWKSTTLVCRYSQEISISPTISEPHCRFPPCGRAVQNYPLTEVFRARLQYDLAQQPRLLDHLPFTLVELLQLALESHRYALDINQDNADLLLYGYLLLSIKIEIDFRQ